MWFVAPLSMYHSGLPLESLTAPVYAWGLELLFVDAELWFPWAPWNVTSNLWKHFAAMWPRRPQSWHNSLFPLPEFRPPRPQPRRSPLDPDPLLLVFWLTELLWPPRLYAEFAIGLFRGSELNISWDCSANWTSWRETMSDMLVRLTTTDSYSWPRPLRMYKINSSSEINDATELRLSAMFFILRTYLSIDKLPFFGAWREKRNYITLALEFVCNDAWRVDQTDYALVHRLTWPSMAFEIDEKIQESKKRSRRVQKMNSRLGILIGSPSEPVDSSVWLGHKIFLRRNPSSPWALVVERTCVVQNWKLFRSSLSWRGLIWGIYCCYIEIEKQKRWLEKKEDQ